MVKGILIYLYMILASFVIKNCLVINYNYFARICILKPFAMEQMFSKLLFYPLIYLQFGY